MKNCVIFAAGEYGSEKINIPENSLIIAADAGYAEAKKRGIKPSLTVGDFDSLGKAPTDTEVVVLPCVKDVTDTFSAAEAGLKNGCNNFIIYGATGGKPDHTLANYAVLVKLVRSGADCSLLGNGFFVTAIYNGTKSFKGKKGSRISVFSFGSKAEGVYIKGLKYTLTNAALYDDFALGVSNEFLDTPAEITVKNGTLLIIAEN